jgi:hypothetical protein
MLTPPKKSSNHLWMPSAVIGCASFTITFIVIPVFISAYFLVLLISGFYANGKLYE